MLRMRKWFIIAGILVAFAFGARIIGKAAIPIITDRHLMLMDTAFDGEAENYRELCGFAVGRWQSRQWFRNHDLIARAGCIVADQPHIKIGGSMEPTGESSIIWTCSVGVANSDHKTVSHKATFKIEYDLAKGTVTLLNTGKTFPIVAEKVYMVYVDEQFNIENFAALDPQTQLTNVHPKVTEMFSFLMLRNPQSK